MSPENEAPGVVRLSADRFDAVLFDLDGVVTDTARLHEGAWKQTFDELLQRRSREEGRSFEPFSAEDYHKYVDGRPRNDGVRGFLAARGISLPEGTPDDPADRDTVYGLAARKTRLFLETVRTEGVTAYPSTVALIHRLRALGKKTALVTASRNRAEVLRAAGLEALFDATVDGQDRQKLGLRGKPEPDTFLEGAKRLEVPPERAIVVEDATAGVEAGHRGGFGITIGVNRNGQAEALHSHGADVVVPDLSQIEIVATAHPWLLVYGGFDPALEGRRETLLALGNGYFVTRGAASEARADEVHYPGTYLAGGYNRITSTIDGRTIEHEDLVNLPNWLPLAVRIGDGEWLDPHALKILDYRRTLDLRRGLYERTVRLRDAQGRVTRLIERRFVHMKDRHLAGQHLSIVAENWAGPITIRALIDGAVSNGGVESYRQFAGAHVRVRQTSAPSTEIVLLDAQTTQSQLGITLAARIRVGSEGNVAFERRPLLESARAGQEIDLHIEMGAKVEVEKIVALHTTRDRASADSATEALASIKRAGTFDELLASHALVWEHLWARADLQAVEIDEDVPGRTHLNVRLHVFHVLQTASHHTADLDAGIPARGWHGEGYRGHVFWDEIFVFPFLVQREPLLARSLLLYRYRRLPEARWAAQAAGYRGAMFPWRSGSDGRDETDVMYLNPRSGRWIQDDTRLERHVGAAVAYNVWGYWQATADFEFLYVCGAELLLEIARFWASAAEWDAERGRYSIRGVMGPDEFHDRYPGSNTPGLNNNAYTNVMASWCLARALEVLDLLPQQRCRELREDLDLQSAELERWDDVSRKLYLPFHSDGVLSQFEGYDALEEFDWEGYRKRYGNIMRLDLILEAEGNSPARYKLSKQADVLMLLYLFSAEELAEIFTRLGYQFDPALIHATVNYYFQRTSYGSTLSGVVHTWVLARATRSRSWPLFTEALHSDVDDIQGGTTREGIHLAAMAGTLDLLQRCYSGLETRGGQLRFHPALPDELKRLSFQVRYRNHSLSFDLTPASMTVASEPGAAAPIVIDIDGHVIELRPGARESISLARLLKD